MADYSDPINADYDEFIAAWRERFPRPYERPPRGTFPPDLNFMADELMSMHKLPTGEWAEVSWGRCFHPNGRMIGVTVARPGTDAWIARTRGVEVFDSMDAAENYLRGLLAEQAA